MRFILLKVIELIILIHIQYSLIFTKRHCCEIVLDTSDMLLETNRLTIIWF